MPRSVALVLYYLLEVFWWLLLIRLVTSWVFALRRDVRASGPIAMLLEVVYTVTDPPLRALGRVIPTLKVGQVAIDLGFLVLVIGVRVLQSVIASYT